MSNALTSDTSWLGSINTRMGSLTGTSEAPGWDESASRTRVGSGWTTLVYLSGLGSLTGLMNANPVLPQLLIRFEGAPEISANEKSPLVKDIRDAAAESRFEDAIADGQASVSPLTEELALKVAAQLVAANHAPQGVGVTGEGRIAFRWSDATQAAMITVGDNGKVRLSSKVGRSTETYGNWSVMEPIPGHYLELLNEHF